jgi:hypothetical protein
VNRRVVPLVLLIAAACTGTAAPHPTASSVAPRPSVAPINPLPPRDVSVWFAPSAGAPDFMDLFDPGAPWTNAAAQIRVFQLPGQWVLDATDLDLSRVLERLASRGLQIAVDAPALSARCGNGREGFAAEGTAVQIVRRIQEAGGSVAFVALDQPYAAGHLGFGCGWSKRRIAARVDDAAAALRALVPGAQLGDVEPLEGEANASDLAEWVLTAAAKLDFFHLRPNLGGPAWADGALQVQALCRARGLPFGIGYSGSGDSDQAFAGSAQEAIAAFEVKADGVPQQVVFESSSQPSTHLLPETQPDTFTWLVDRYFRTRSHLDIEIGPSQFVGSDRVNGILSDASGARIPGAAVAITMTPVNADGSLGFVYDLGTRSTDAEGAFQLTFRPPGVNLHFGKVLISAWFAGDDRYWPAYRSGTAVV